ncbi:hypothetical protein JW710_01755 [Candidatus Dojkabacteria bacterium]|nr:hypothetical protein [Candidatus Dojkabacteria bacterium]
MMKNFLEVAKDFAYTECARVGPPPRQHIDLPMGAALKLAKELESKGQLVNTNIVRAGICLMDCMIGEALEQGRLEDHVKMSLEKANELMAQSDVGEEAKENIRHCILEHHGVKKFYSIESEICCNADCYKFASVEGFIYAFRNLSDIPEKKLAGLLREKLEEKWNALTFDFCKDELRPQYEIIKKILRYLDNSLVVEK